MTGYKLSRTNRRILLFLLPILAVVSFILFTRLPQSLEKQDQIVQTEIRSGWTTSLQEFGTGSGESGGRGGDIAIDDDGNIWVSGGPGLTGLHVFNGEEWITRDGDFQDLAIDPGGQIWAVHTLTGQADGVEIFDGDQRKSYQDQDFDIQEEFYEISQVEISNDGRIWAVIDAWPQQSIFEILKKDQDYTAASDPVLVITGGEIKSLDADNQGNIWASVWQYQGGSTEWPSGLYRFDGESWQRIPDQDTDLRRIVRTRFDDQGLAWAMTDCGGLMTYDGAAWQTIVDEDTSPVCGRNWAGGNGFFVDNQDRLWFWELNSLHLQSDGGWKSFTSENSGLADFDYGGSFIFGVFVDDLDQVWIASTAGISMVHIDEATPFPEENVIQHQAVGSQIYSLNGMNWFVPSVLFVLWLAVLLNTLPGVLLSLAAGMLIILIFGPPQETIPQYGFSRLNPGVAVIFGGVLGAIIGGMLDNANQNRGSPNKNLNFKLAIVGLVVGFGIGIVWWILSTP